jgi:hypothetical protein
VDRARCNALFGFHITQRLPHPTTIATAEFVVWCADRLAPYAPVHRWLAANAGGPA